MTRALLVALLAAGGGASCVTVTPALPRFVAVYDQQSAFCRVQVIRDTRSTACFITFQCRRQPVQALAVAPEVCVP